MKIAYVINNVTHTSIPIEMANLISKREEVTILALYDNQEKAENVVREVAPSCHIIGFGYKANKRKALKAFFNELKSGEYDIIHTHQTLSGALARLVAFRKSKAKIIHTVHANHHSFNWKQNMFVGFTLHRCDKIAFNSQTTQNGLYGWQKWWTRKVSKIVIYNGVNVKKIRSINNGFSVELCKKYDIMDGDFVFAQIGRLEKVKNPYSSLCAFENMLKEKMSEMHRKCWFIFVGDGKERTRLEKKIAQNEVLKKSVIMTGTLKREEVYSLMKRINAMIVPSFYEGFCNALFEGMASALPLAVSNIAVFDELLEKNVDIYQFNPADINEISDKMYDIFTRKWKVDEREKWVKLAYENFDSSRCIESYLNTYYQMIK